jgi:hypothetical protein
MQICQGRRRGRPESGKFLVDRVEFRADLVPVSGFCTGSCHRAGFFAPPDQTFDRVIRPAHDILHKFRVWVLQPLRPLRVVC